MARRLDELGRTSPHLRFKGLFVTEPKTRKPQLLAGVRLSRIAINQGRLATVSILTMVDWITPAISCHGEVAVVI